MKRLSGKVVIPTLVVGTAMATTPFIVDGIRGPQYTYCTDANGTVVNDRYCDTTYHPGGGYFISRGYYRTPYYEGQRLPHTSSRVSSTDSAGRSKAGYSSSGSVATGKKGGFGHSASSGKSSGSGGKSSGS